MPRRKRSGRSGRVRIGAVTVYPHHGAWWLQYREGGRRRRRRAGDDREEAVASAVNAQLAAGQRSMFAFGPVDFDAMLDRWLEHLEHVVRVSVATLDRYRTATDHASRFVHQTCPGLKAHEFDASRFVRWLRELRVAPNGHPNATTRPLTAKGIQFILATCRSAFGYAARARMLPPYAENPLADLPIKRLADGEPARPIHVFTADEEYAFLKACDRWQFALFYTLARTGLRPSELTHLMVEDIDLDKGLLRIRNKPELKWQVKTRRSREIPLPEEPLRVLRHVIGERTQGVLFLRRRFMNEIAPLSDLGSPDLRSVLERRVELAEHEAGRSLTRSERLRVARGVWRDAGAIKPEKIRDEFMKVTAAIGMSEVTAPKCWRHSFATLMLEAGVDPLIRQLTLGHKPADAARAALGMTSVYTHPSRSVHRAHLQLAVDLRPKTSGLVRQFLNDNTQG